MTAPRILLIEDDPDSAEAMTLLLEMEGFEVGCAANGREAIEAFRQTHRGRRPDLVLLDLMLPDMEAVELVDRLGEIDAPPPIVIHSAAHDSAIQSVALQVGAIGTLRKPTVGKSIAEFLRGILSRSPAEIS